MAGHQSERISEDVKREIIAIIRELKDPRVNGKMITVSRTEISSDVSFVKVFVSSIEGLDVAKNAVKGLTCANGYIRREIGKRLRLRKTPELKFIADNSIEDGMEIVRKINDLNIRSETNED